MRGQSLWFDALTLTTVLVGFAAVSFAYFFSRGGATDARGAGTLMTAIFLLFGLVALDISATPGSHRKKGSSR